MCRSIISCSLSPNTEADDVLLAVRYLLMPWTWKNGSAIKQAEKWFERYFRGHKAISFNSGRSALLAILRAFDIGKGDDILIQAFTCVAVPNSVRWAGSRPVYVDIDDTLNLDISDAEKKITPKTKVIIVQHTFGIPADMDKVLKFAKKHKLILIEDCAHSLGATYRGKKVGTLGDAAFFSFGRDKVVSSVFGGMATINAKCKMQNAKLKEYQEKLPNPSHFWIFQQLLHPVAFSAILLLYNVIIGKVLLVLLQKLGLLTFPVYPEEKRGQKPADFPAKFTNSLAVLLLQQLVKLERYNKNRKVVAQYYESELKRKNGVTQAKMRGGSIFLRYAVFVDDPHTLLHKAKQQAVLLGNWYHNIVDPKGVDYAIAGYRLGSCPKAQEAAEQTVNLPTRISKAEADRVIAAL